MYLKRSNKFILLAVIVFSSFFTGRYLTHKTTFYGDALGYYIYLPSTFIYHNLTNSEPYPENRGLSKWVHDYRTEVQHRNENDTVINRYTYGVALAEMPFFLVAHAYELARGSMANGFTASYELLIKISTLFYALLGLMLVYKILRRFFEETPAIVGTSLLLVCTNLFWFTIFQTGMSHVPLFFLYALLLYLTIRVHERPAMKLFAAIGMVAGLISIIRPTDIMCLLIPLLYDVYDRDSLRRKVELLRDNLPGILLMAGVFVVPVLPQLLYWKLMTGHFFYYSYRGESFNWGAPKIVEGLLYFSNGWLPYSPIMVFSLFGLMCTGKIRQWVLCICILLPVYVYIIYSWYCYNYINGLGSRPMLHMYPLLSLPLTAFLVYVWHRPVWVRAFVSMLILFFVALNIDYCNRQRSGILLSEESNFQFNLQTLFRNDLRYNDLVVNDIAEFQPDTAKLIKIATIGMEHYNDSVSEYTVPDPVTGHKYVYHMYQQEHLKISLAILYNKKLFAGAKWLKCSGRFMCTQYPDYFRHLLVADIGGKLWKGCKIENKNFVWQPSEGSDHMRLSDYRLNTWGTVYYFTRLPANLEETDVVKLFVWSPNRAEMYADDLCLELYK